MIEFCCLLFLLSPIIYFATAIVIYFKKKEARGFIQMVVFPLPFALFVGMLLYGSYTEPENFRFLTHLLIGASIFAGIGVITHQLIDKDRKRLSMLTRMPASILLIGTPFLLLVPEIFAKVAPISYVIIGALLGIFGYIRYYQGKKIGLVYAYSAILFFVAAPLVSLVISYIYFDMMKDNVIYRRAYWGDVTCHDIGYPVIFFQEEFIKPFLFSSGYLGLMGIVAYIRKYLLKRKMGREGLIPKEYDEVLKGNLDE
ncbi:MAG: hypothetical protein U9R75_10055 [Candidatus Thermoplasmatota archaeon]|nr:hypothetical protein [Candidatus Thermoplasmatota archaeon]